MKSLIRLISCVVAIGSATDLLADDKVVSVDPAASLVTIEENGAVKVYRTKPFTEVSINGVKAPLDQLRPGMVVTLTRLDTQTASKIVARGLGAASDPNKPKPFFERPDANLATRRILIKMRIDGSDKILYRDGQLWIEHLKFKKPDMITVNGIDWKPSWKGDTSDPFTEFKPAPAPVGQAHVVLKQISGRAKASMEKSLGSKFEKIPTVLVEDDQTGADTYEFQLSW